MDPLNPSLRPAPTPPVPPRRPEPPVDAVDLSRRLDEGGGELGLRRRFRLPFMDPVKRLEPAEAARVLQEGGPRAERLRVTPAGLETPLPLRTVQDLQEAVDFQDGRAPADAGALPRLAAQGWHFHARLDDVEAEVGLYGGYNALTDPALALTDLHAVRDGIRVSLADAAAAAALADFSDDPTRGGALGPSLAKLEADGYRFYDATGKEHGAFEAAQAPGYHVGREGEPWFPVRHLDPQRTEGQLATFAAFRELGDTPLELWDEFRAAQRDPERLANLVAGGRTPRERQGRARAVLEGLAHLAGSPGVARLGAATAGERPELVKEIAARWAETDPLAFAQGVHQAVPAAGPLLLRGLAEHDADAAVFHAAVTAQATQVARDATAGLYLADPHGNRVDQLRKAMATLAPTHCGPERRLDAVRLGTRLLEGVPTPAADFARVLLGAAEEPTGFAILNAFLAEPTRADAAAFARMAAGLSLYPGEAVPVYRAALERLAQHPPFAETAARALAAAGLPRSDEPRAAMLRAALLDLQPASEAQFALRAMDAMTAGSGGYRYRDDAARVGMAALERLKGTPSADFALSLAGDDAHTQFLVARAFLAHPDAKTPEELLAPVREAANGCYPGEGARLVATALERVKSHPPFAATIARAQRAAALVGRDEPRFTLLKMVLADPQGASFADPATFGLRAMEAITSGNAGYQYRPEAACVGVEFLRELKAGFALELAGSDPYTQFQVARAFLSHPAGDPLIPVREAMGSLYAAEGNRVATAAVARLATHPTFAGHLARAGRTAELIGQSEPRFAFWKRVLQDPEGKTTPSPESFALAAMETITSGNSGYQYREDAARVGMAALREAKAEFALELAGPEVHTQYQVARAFLAHAGATTPEQELAPVREVLDRLYAAEGSRVAALALQRHQSHPPFAANFTRALKAAELVQKPEPRLALLKMALRNPAGLTDEAFALQAMSAVTSGNSGHQYREEAARLGMAALSAAGTDCAALGVELAGRETYTQYQVAQNFLAAVGAKTPEEQVVLVDRTVGALYSTEGARVAGEFLARVAGHPPFATTVGRALAAAAHVQQAEPRAHVLRLALQDPLGNAFPTEAEFALAAMAAATRGNSGHQYREEAARLGMAALESLKAKPAAQFALAVAGSDTWSQVTVAEAFLSHVEATTPQELLVPARQVVEKLSTAAIGKPLLQRFAGYSPLVPKALSAVEGLQSNDARRAVYRAVFEDLETAVQRDDLDFGVRLVNAVAGLRETEDAAELARWTLDTVRVDPALEPAASFGLDVAVGQGAWMRLRVASVALASARATGREAMFTRAVDALTQCGSSARPLLRPVLDWLAARPELSVYRSGVEALASSLTEDTKPEAVIEALAKMQKLARETEGFVDRALGGGERGPVIQEDDGFVQIGPVRLPKAPSA